MQIPFGRPIRRLVTRLVGQGPSGVIRPFVWHAHAQHENSRRGLTWPERFTGVVHSEPGEPSVFARPKILTPEGIVHPNSPLVPPATQSGLGPAIPATLFSLSPGAVVGNTCLVYCPKTRVTVEESVKLWDTPISRHPLFYAPRVAPAKHLPGVGLLLGVLGIESFYHFLLECLPKVEMSRPWWHAIDFFFVNGKAGGYVERWLNHAGLPSEKLIWIGDSDHFSCDQLLFTNMLTRHHYVTPPVLRHLHALWPRGERGAATKKIWITRRHAYERHLSWEDALLDQLPGFEIVEMQTLPPDRQLELLRSASVIAGPHGAGLAGMVFAPTDAMVFEFCETQSRGANACFSRLAQVAGIKHQIVMVDFAHRQNLTWLGQHIR